MDKLAHRQSAYSYQTTCNVLAHVPLLLTMETFCRQSVTRVRHWVSRAAAVSVYSTVSPSRVRPSPCSNTDPAIARVSWANCTHECWCMYEANALESHADFTIKFKILVKIVITLRKLSHEISCGELWEMLSLFMFICH